MSKAAELGSAFWQRAARRKKRGLLALAVAAGLWVWLAYLLAAPYSVDGTHQCAALLFRDLAPASQCLQTRTWWQMLGLLGAALPMSVMGVGLYVAGSVSQSLCYHLQEVEYFEAREPSVDST
ncbi:hypothetical protein OG301_00120 [Streptomyces platensis]|uniref:hypothetical protein n=1 Tax=Streptomyces platensis TaxID=58346 RepID=UPI002E25E143|nr:hypothetical protein OG301_00120 [Streptomyces platensis]